MPERIGWLSAIPQNSCGGGDLFMLLTGCPRPHKGGGGEDKLTACVLYTFDTSCHVVQHHKATTTYHREEGRRLPFLTYLSIC